MIRTSRQNSLLCVLLLLALPAAFLWPCLFGNDVFLPFDPARFPPAGLTMTAAERAALDQGAIFDVTETPVTFVPEMRFASQELDEGRLPHWNPHARFGASLLATSVVGMLYPPNWINLLAVGDPVRGLGLNAWLGFAIAGLLAFGLLRDIGLRCTAALFGAVAFCLSSTLVANPHFYQRFHALIWLPGALWCVRRIAVHEGRRPALATIGLALCLAMSWLAGFPAFAAACTLVAAGYAALQVGRRLREVGARSAARLSLWLGLGGVCGLLLAAVQLLPMFAFFPDSNRDPNPSLDQIASQAFDPLGFLGYLSPALFAHPAQPQLPSNYSPFVWWLWSRTSWVDGKAMLPSFNYIEYAVFPGGLVALLALVGATTRTIRFRTFAVLALLGLWLLAWAPWWMEPLLALPGVRSVPPMRFIAPASLLVAALAAIALDVAPRALNRLVWLFGSIAALLLAITAFALRAWLAAGTPAEWFQGAAPDIAFFRSGFPNADVALAQSLLGPHLDQAFVRAKASLLHTGIVFAVAGAWLFLLPYAKLRRRGPQTMRLLALALTLIELGVLARPLLHTRSAPLPLDTDVQRFLREERDAHRATGGFAVARAVAGSPQIPEALPPCLLVPEHIRDLHAYTFVDARSHRLFAGLWGEGQMLRAFWPMAFPDDPRLQHPLLDAMGVRYVLSTTPLQHAGERVGPHLRGPGGEFFIYRRPQAMPRAFVVHSRRELPDEDAVVAAMTADPGPGAAASRWHPEQEVLLTGEQLRQLDAVPLPPDAPSPSPRQVRFVRDTPTEVELHVDAGAPGYLVMSDALMRGWTATVDGTATPITRGNLFMRVLPLPERAVAVTMRFTTPRLGLGLWVTAGTLLLLLALCRLPADTGTDSRPPHDPAEVS